jgi:hypothetical protein
MMKKTLVVLAAVAIGCGGATKGEDDPGLVDDPGEVGAIDTVVDQDLPDDPELPGDPVVGPGELGNAGPGVVDPKPGDSQDLGDLFVGDSGTDAVRPIRPVCFCIEDEQNISEIFIDFGGCDVGRFRVFARTPFYDGFLEFTDELKDVGGPCEELSRDYWFVLPGPDRGEPQVVREAEVCILMLDGYAKTRVGYHAGDTCTRATRVDAARGGSSCGGYDYPR